MVLDGVTALRAVEDFRNARKERNERLTDAEKATLDVVERDALHAAVHQYDVHSFGEFDRLKLVELEYLYQVRGLRQVMPSAIFREGYAGYGNSWTGSKIRLLYPQDRKRGGRKSREPFLPINKVHETARLGTQLVPLRINIVTDKYQLHDRLLWNVDDTTIPLELFVENTLEDYGLPLSLAPEVCKSLQHQISNHLPHIFPRIPDQPTPVNSSDHPEPAKPELSTEGKDNSVTTTSSNPSESSVTNEINVESNNSVGDDSKMFDEALISNEMSALLEPSTVIQANKRPTVSDTPETQPPEPNTEANPESEPKPPQVDAKYDEDMRITIKLDITIGQHQLVDQFEWDVNNQDNNPEMFGLILANELALPLEFATAVAHSIREQCQSFSLALFNSGYQFDGKPPTDPKLQNELSLPIDSHAFLRRPEELPLYTPVLNETRVPNSDDDLQEQEHERRELRSRRRQGRSSRRHLHDSRSGAQVNTSASISLIEQDFKGPDVSTPYYSSILPGGVDRNLSILRMVTYREDEMYGGDKQDMVFHFNKNLRKYDVQNLSQFDEFMTSQNKPKWLVKLKLPKNVK